MKTPSHGVLRDLLALIIVAISCPLAVFGGTNLACVGQGFTSQCAMTAVVLSPLLLAVGGVLAGLATRGWTGLLVVGVGTIVGMFSILVLSAVAGRPVPVDFFSGVVATVWFMGPIVIGYGIGRGIWHLAELRNRRRGNTP